MPRKKRHIRPPFAAQKVLNWILPDFRWNTPLGDFEEFYNQIIEEEGRLKGYVWYWIQVFNLLPRRLINAFYWSNNMFKNYFKTAVRNIIRNKSHSAINIFGLSIGIALSLLIFLFVRNEFSYDTFHTNADRVFQAARKVTRPGRPVRLTGSTASPMAAMMKDKIADIELASRLTSTEAFVKINNEVYKHYIHAVDPDFLEMLTFKVINGNLHRALSDKQSIVLTRKMTEKYFNGEDPTGKTLELIYENESFIFNITAVVDNFPKESSLDFEFLINADLLLDWWGDWMNSYSANSPTTLIMINETSTIDDLRSKMHIAEEVIQSSNSNTKIEINVIPLKDIHLTSEYENDEFSVSDPMYSYILTGLGLLVLIIACVNYVLLSIGRASSRAKEIGIRKVVGAFRSQLKKQYLGEAILISFLALGIGLLIAFFVLPAFNSLADKALEIKLDTVNIGAMVLLMSLVGLTAGIYPAFLLSGFNPVSVLKGRIRFGTNKVFGKSLVIVQFSITIFLLIMTLFMRGQIDYLRSKDLGYNKEQVVIHPLFTIEDDYRTVFNRYRDELKKNPKIIEVTAQSEDFGIRWTKTGFRMKNNITRSYFVNVVDAGYLKTMGIGLKDGRDFLLEHGSDLNRSLIVNKAFLEYFGFENDPFNSSLPSDSLKSRRIIGIMEDFNFHSLHKNISPLVLALSEEALISGPMFVQGTFPLILDVALIRIQEGETMNTLKYIEDTWKKIAPDKIFEPQFLDETVQEQYVSENRWLKIINYTSLIAIFIACLGLLGLSTIAVENRIKEIGIRKILGSSSGSIVNLLSKEFILLVIAANVISWPAAYYIIEKWLQNFAFSTGLNIASFLIGSLIALLIAFSTISFRTIKAANSNPVKALRYE